MVKVKTIETYKDSQGKHLVTKAIFLLVPCNADEPIIIFKDKVTNKLYTNVGIGANEVFNDKYYTLKPILISETEEIEVDDNGLVYKYSTPIIHTCTHINNYGASYKWEDKSLIPSKTNCEPFNDKYIKGYKILALSEQFSSNQLQSIIDGKLKDSDEVYIECYKDYTKEGKELRARHQSSSPYEFMSMQESFIKLTNNHIKLFKVNKEESWEDIKQEYMKENPPFDNDKVSYEKWLELYYNPPKSK